MDLRPQQVAAIVIVVGALAFIGAAALPVSFRVFPEPSPVRRLQHIEASPTSWTVAQVLFGLGATLTVGGIALLIRTLGEDAARLGRMGVLVLLVGLVPWIWHLYARTVDPAAFAAGSWPVWPLMVYFVLTEVGLAIYGAALLATDLPAWVGWLVIATMALVLAITLITRDMVPAVYYLVTLVTGVVLYR